MVCGNNMVAEVYSFYKTQEKKWSTAESDHIAFTFWKVITTVQDNQRQGATQSNPETTSIKKKKGHNQLKYNTGP